MTTEKVPWSGGMGGLRWLLRSRGKGKARKYWMAMWMWMWTLISGLLPRPSRVVLMKTVFGLVSLFYFPSTILLSTYPLLFAGRKDYFTPVDYERHPRSRSQRRRRTKDSYSGDKGLGPDIKGENTEEGNLCEEAKMPPKLRKRWIHQSSETLKEANASADASQPGGLASPRGKSHLDGPYIHY
jgi:hypothetical protein